MPFKVDENAMKKQMYWNVSRPQEVAPDALPEGWLGTVGGGLPVKQIPHYEFPIVVYFWPSRPFREIEHRNDKFEVVGTERIATEHLSKTVACKAHINGGPKECVQCNEALDAALAEGWTRQAYIPKAPAKPDDDLYGRKKK
jgi:hypothetical protein